MSRRSITAIRGFLLLFSPAFRQTNEIEKAAWLIGTWKSKTPQGSIYEHWGRRSATVFAGTSFILKGKDSVVFETIELVQEAETLVYKPSVKNQNGGLPVSFTLKTISANQLIFENPKHDFPQMISYTKINADSLVAEISGIKNGKERKQGFPMKRVR